MSWLNFNDSLNNLKGQLTNLASGVLTDTTDSADTPSSDKNYEDLQQLIASQASEIVALRKENAELFEKYGIPQNGHLQNEKDKWSWDPPDTSQNTQQSISIDNSNILKDLKKKISDLEFEKTELIASLEAIDLDCKQTTEKVINLRDDLQNKYDDLQSEHEDVLEKCDNLQKENAEKIKSLQQLQNEKTNLLKLLKDSKKSKQTDNSDELKNRITELEEKNLSLKNELEEVLSKKIADLEVNNEKVTLEKHINELNTLLKEYKLSHASNKEEYEKLERILQGYEEQVRNYKTQCELLQTENQKLMERENKIVLELSTLRTSLDKTNNDVLNVDEKYVNLLTDSFKKFMDYALPVDVDVQTENSFMTAVETIMKILLDLKWKTETLKKEVDDMTEEKRRILTEKNHEINKLIENSELLSQEVIAKSQALKNYEEENSELIKNNDNLINQLELCKFNTRGLHTISESNEDNLLILETQLEKSNKKIRELEMTISDLENSKQEATVEVQTELEYIKKQLNLTGTELSQSKNEYQILLEEYQQLKADHTKLQNEFDDVRNSYDKCYNENESLSTTMDKIQTEFENTEYKYSEINISMETLKEEIENLKSKIDTLTKSNKKLEMSNLNYEGKNELMQNEVDDLKQQLTSELEYREQQDLQIRNLSEKLQNAKMSETYLKLQNDTLNKELKTTTEARQTLSLKYDNLTENYKEMENYLKKYEEENNNLTEKCKEIEKYKTNSEDLEKIRNKNVELTEKLKISEEERLHLKEDNENIKANRVTLDLQEYETKISTLEKENLELNKQLSIVNEQLLDTSNNKENLSKQFEDVNKTLTDNSKLLKEYTEKIENLEKYIQELTNSRNEMVNFVNTKHQENIQYHTEIQRLNQVLYTETEKYKKLEEDLKNAESTNITNDKNDKILELENEISKMKEEMEKLTDQNDFLRKKSEVLAQNLLEEQSKVQQVIAEKNNAISEKEASLSKELQRLRDHLIESEEAHTQEMVLAEKRIQEMQTKVSDIEQREKESSTHYTSVNIRTNQHVETLQNQLQMVTNQRDDLRKKMSDSEDQISKQSAALSNLQFVLEQFQKDKEKDVYHETERIRRQINAEKQKQEELQVEITNLKSQLAESKQGLLAASRLSNQVETSKQQVANMKNEITKLEEKLKKSEEKYNSIINQTDAKVDKMLVKNLIIGFIGSNNNFTKDQQQILKIIATVLDFNQEDNERVNMNKSNQGSGFLNAILYPQSVNRDQSINQESLSQAFVRFLENESTPRQLPNLLETAQLDSTSSNNPPNEKPILLSQVVLPTFADFGQSRSSSSILKDVLKDNH